MIEADLAAGEIDLPTAALYEIWALFGDEALPEQYRGGGSVGENIAVLHWPLAHRTEIPDEIYAQMEPYLLRPADPGSAFYGGDQPDAETGLVADGTAVAALANGATALEDCDFSANKLWAIQTATVPIKVWSRCVANYRSDIEAVVEQFDDLYPKEVRVMGPPLADFGIGGDDAIDVYIVDDESKECPNTAVPTTRCFSFPPVSLGASWGVGIASSLAWSGFMAMKRSTVRSDELRNTVAHEFFHVLGFAHNAQGLDSGLGSHWMVEASAEWAESNFVRERSAEHIHIPLFVNQFQYYDASLNAPNVSAETKDQGPAQGFQLGYRSYIWPYFMQQESGGDPAIMGRAWRALEGATTFAAADASLDTTFSFGDHFGDFAVRNYNRELQGDPLKVHHWDMDPLFPRNQPPFGVRQGKFTGVEVVAKPQFKEWELALSPLTSRYRGFAVGETSNVRQIEIDLSGLGGSGGELQADAIVHLASGDWQRRTLDHGLTKWCRDDPADDIDGFTLILSNSSFDDGDKLQGIYKTAGREICDPVPDLSGWVEYTVDVGGFHFEASAHDMAWKLREDVDGQYDLVAGTVTWSWSGADGQCTIDGAGSEPMVPDDLEAHPVEFRLGQGISEGQSIGREIAHLIIFWSGDSPTYNVAGTTDLTQRSHVVCPDRDEMLYSSLIVPTLNWWLNTAIEPLKVENGRIIAEGESGDGQITVKRRWHFEGRCPSECPGQ